MRRRIGRDWIDMGPASAFDWAFQPLSVCVNGHVREEVGSVARGDLGRNDRCAECNREAVRRHRERRRAVIPAI